MLANLCLRNPTHPPVKHPDHTTACALLCSQAMTGFIKPEVLETFKDRPVQMALIVDEYGALRGIVTQTDLLEALAGEITDADDELDVMKREDGSFLVDATMPVGEAFGQLGIAGVPHDGGEYRTLAGFVLWRLGRIPVTGEHFEWEAAGDLRRFEVVDMDGHRVDKVLISKAEPKPAFASEAAVLIAGNDVKYLPSP